MSMMRRRGPGGASAVRTRVPGRASAARTWVRTRVLGAVSKARNVLGRAAPGALGRRVAGSPRWRVLRMMWETSPALMVIMGLFVLADGVLPILALVALGQAVGRIPRSEEHTSELQSQFHLVC